MNYYKIFLIIGFQLMLLSCGGDDDICESGEGTPRLKIAFKNESTEKAITLDTLYVSVDYGAGKVDLGRTANNNTRLIPLRVDDSPYTDLYFKTRKSGNETKVRLNYTTQSTYVSPGCGVRKVYEGLNSELITPNPVKKIEIGQNFIENEDKTHLYLIF